MRRLDSQTVTACLKGPGNEILRVSEGYSRRFGVEVSRPICMSEVFSIGFADVAYRVDQAALRWGSAVAIHTTRAGVVEVRKTALPGGGVLLVASGAAEELRAALRCRWPSLSLEQIERLLSAVSCAEVDGVARFEGGRDGLLELRDLGALEVGRGEVYARWLPGLLNQLRPLPGTDATAALEMLAGALGPEAMLTPMRSTWRVTARPPKGRDGRRWQLRYFPPKGQGTPYQRSAKTESEAEARSFARAEQARLNGTSLPLEEAMRARLENLASLGSKENTLASLRTAINRIGPEILNPTPESIVRAQDKLLGEGLAAKTINNYMHWASASWTWCRKRGLVSEPWPDCDDLKEKRTDLRPCTPAETGRLLAYFASRSGKWAWEGPYFALLAAAGSRVTETMRLQGRDLNRQTGEVRFRAGETKAGERRIAVVPVEVLAMIPEVEGEIWPNLRYWGVDRAWKRALKATGLQEERIRPHSMRRAWITDALDAGAPLNHVMAQVGHRNPRTTLGYEANATARNLAQSADKVAEYRAPHTHPTNVGGATVESQATKGGQGEQKREVYCSIEVDPTDETQAGQGFAADRPPGLHPTEGEVLRRILRDPALRTWLLSILD